MVDVPERPAAVARPLAPGHALEPLHDTVHGEAIIELVDVSADVGVNLVVREDMPELVPLALVVRERSHAQPLGANEDTPPAPTVRYWATRSSSGSQWSIPKRLDVVPDTCLSHSIPSSEVTTVPPCPTATKMCVLFTALKLADTPEDWMHHVTLSSEVRIVPAFPTAASRGNP